MYDRCVAPKFLDSSKKHGISKEDTIYAILNANYIRVLEHEQTDKGLIRLYIGPRHAQTEREVEILVHEFPGSGDDAVIFHVADLGPKYRRYREEHQ